MDLKDYYPPLTGYFDCQGNWHWSDGQIVLKENIETIYPEIEKK